MNHPREHFFRPFPYKYLQLPLFSSIFANNSKKMSRVLVSFNYTENMKKGIHPESYRPVVFKDMSNDDVFITRSTVATKETIDLDGVTYPLVKLEISSSSHPFYTGKQKLVDTAGRVDKFINRYKNRGQKK